MKILRKYNSTIIVLLIILTFSACQTIIPALTAELVRSEFKNTQLENRVHKKFWNTLHQGKYDSLQRVIELLHYAYMQDKNDFKLAAHLGFAYTWQVTERWRKENPKADIAASADLAQRYFEESVILNPNDPRLRGFEAGLMITNGSRHGSDKLTTKGYFRGKKAIRMWPSFNYFSVGYVLSVVPYKSERYKEGLEMQWKNLEECLCRKINREKPDLSDLHKIPERVEDDYKKNRACRNSWIAPHNVEGFMLNLGDMLVKNGDTAQAREVYESIPLIAEFNNWPFKSELKSRLENLEENVEYFRSSSKGSEENRNVFIQTEYGCMACHQKSEPEFRAQNDTIPLDKSTYFID